VLRVGELSPKAGRTGSPLLRRLGSQPYYVTLTPVPCSDAKRQVLQSAPDYRPGRTYDSSTPTTADSIGRDATIGFSTVRVGRTRIVEFRTDGGEMHLCGS
jgi:hypothetical protein